MEAKVLGVRLRQPVVHTRILGERVLRPTSRVNDRRVSSAKEENTKKCPLDLQEKPVRFNCFPPPYLPLAFAFLKCESVGRLDK